MYCFNCGKNINDRATSCIHCGVRVSPVLPPREGYALRDQGPLDSLLSLTCFMQPTLGIIFYLIWKNNSPTRAKAAMKWAVIGISVQFALIAIGMLFATSFMSSAYIAYP
ncbi:MAG: zinc ribbon domain-containing protein [Candidatus Cloacimonetes bacterium]|nr:zinc ribbon domain-containing protein [Candidatus Cloacimonadota bacterium]